MKRPKSSISLVRDDNEHTPFPWEHSQETRGRCFGEILRMFLSIRHGMLGLRGREPPSIAQFPNSVYWVENSAARKMQLPGMHPSPESAERALCITKTATGFA